MEIILLERIDRLGQMGDVVNVKNGYARNYLFPQHKALRKTADNMKLFESKRKEYEAINAKLKSEAEEMAKKMAGLSVTIIRQAAETGQLYGSVTGRDICDAIADAGFKIQRRQVKINEAFKVMGMFDVAIALHPDVEQTVRVVIARSEAEAKKVKEKKTKVAKVEKDETAKVEKAEGPKAEAEKVEEPKAEKPKATKTKKAKAE